MRMHIPSSLATHITRSWVLVLSQNHAHMHGHEHGRQIRPDSNTSTPKPCKTCRTHPICHWHTKVLGADAFQHLCNTPSRCSPAQHTCDRSSPSSLRSHALAYHDTRVDGKKSMYAHALEGQSVARPRAWSALRRARSGSIWQPALMPRKVHRRGLVSPQRHYIRTTSAPKFRVKNLMR